MNSYFLKLPSDFFDGILYSFTSLNFDFFESLNLLCNAFVSIFEALCVFQIQIFSYFLPIVLPNASHHLYVSYPKYACLE